MSVLEGALFVLVALGGTAVVLTRDPLRQTLVNGVFGVLLAVTFFVFQAPDVALSEIVIGSVALPVMLLLGLAKLRERQAERERAESDE